MNDLQKIVSNKYKIILFILFAINYLFGYAQLPTENVGIKNLFRCETSDILYWNGKPCMISISPLSHFSRYDSLYPQIPHVRIKGVYGKTPLGEDKNYFCSWAIVNERWLYLTEVDSRGFNSPTDRKKLFPNNEFYQRMEKLTGEQFKKKASNIDKNIPVGAQGILSAKWFTGVIYVKPFQDKEPLKQWEASPFQKLTFKNGLLISVETIDFSPYPKTDKKGN